MAASIDAPTLKGALSDGREIALIDVREHGQFGEGHPFFAVPLAYSRFELGLPALVPNARVRLVLCDAGDGVAERAADRAEALGYGNVAVLAGGVGAWQAAGYTLYARPSANSWNWRAIPPASALTKSRPCALRSKTSSSSMAGRSPNTAK
jgi:rhodanese-related sulfurtransferase